MQLDVVLTLCSYFVLSISKAGQCGETEMARQRLVYAFHDKTLYVFERAERRTHSHFGGPPPREITGRPFGPKPLHQIACLSHWHITALGRNDLRQLPLIHGMYFDGCELSYRVESGHKIEILKIKPAQSLDNWPYANFPPLLPYVPLRLDDTPRRASYDEFAKRFPNMPSEPPELIVAVPPPSTIGLSLWGDSGDWDDVTIIFECDLKKREVKSYPMGS
jgi:hypothetical protein